MTLLSFLARLTAQIPWTAAQLWVEGALLASVARRPARAGERPWGERYERIGPDWLTGVLRDGGVLVGGAEVVAVELERIGEVGQMSAVFRVRPTYGRGAPGSLYLVLKTTAPRMKDWVLNAVLGVFETELRCYRLPRPERGLLRPNCWYAAQHRLTRSSILALDDLSPGVVRRSTESSRRRMPCAWPARSRGITRPGGSSPACARAASRPRSRRCAPRLAQCVPWPGVRRAS